MTVIFGWLLLWPSWLRVGALGCCLDTAEQLDGLVRGVPPLGVMSARVFAILCHVKGRAARTVSRGTKRRIHADEKLSNHRSMAASRGEVEGRVPIRVAGSLLLAGKQKHGKGNGEEGEEARDGDASPTSVTSSPLPRARGRALAVAAAITASPAA